MAKTVTFSDGRKVRFGERRKPSSKNLPYVFARGKKIELPSGVSHGMLFQHGQRTYVAFNFTDEAGRHWRYGQPVTIPG